MVRIVVVDLVVVADDGVDEIMGGFVASESRKLVSFMSIHDPVTVGLLA